MTDLRQDVVLEDPVSGENIGLRLLGALDLHSANPMATRVVQDKTFADFDEWSYLQQSSWAHGRGLEDWDTGDMKRYYDSYNLDTRIRNQITLAPAISSAIAGTNSNIFQDGHTWADWPLAAGSGQQKYGQSFQVAGAGTFAVTKMALRLKTAAASGTVTLRVETDNAGAPSGTLASANATQTINISGNIGADTNWITFTFASFDINKGAAYWLVLATDQATPVYLHACATNVYANGESKVYNGAAWVGTGSYGALPYGYTSFGVNGDIYFMLLDEADLSGDVTCFAIYGSAVYCGAGKAVYRWDTGISAWIASKSDFANNVSDMAAFGGALWVAHSDGNLWTYNGTAWAEKTGLTASCLLVYKGYLYRGGLVASDNRIYYTADGATWDADYWLIGDGSVGRAERITGLAGYDADVYAVTTYGLYLIGPPSSDGVLVDQLKAWDSQKAADNGKGIITWAKDGALYFPVGHQLLRFDGQSLNSVGPDEDAGLPTGRQGSIVDLVSLTNWLLVALDAGTGGTSSVLAYNGQGWHELVRVPALGQRCLALGYDTTVSPNRLWFGYGKRTGYIKLPDTTANPYQYSASQYEKEGYFITPWMGLEMLQVDKDFHEVLLKGKLPAGASIEAQYQIDRYGTDSSGWATLCTAESASADNISRYTFPFESAFTATPVVSAGSTAKQVMVNSAAELSAGHWVRVNDEVRQIQSVGAGSVTLQSPLSIVPAAGSYVYPSRPCGKEIRLRIWLRTADSGSTPKLEAWQLKCMPMLMDRLAGSLTAEIATVSVMRNGAQQTLSAAEAVSLLKSFARRPTPVYLYDKRGSRYTVKVSNVREQQRDRINGADGASEPVNSIVSLAIVEV